MLSVFISAGLVFRYPKCLVLIGVGLVFRIVGALSGCFYGLNKIHGLILL